MKCNNCDKDIDNDSKYCCFCGNKIDNLSDTNETISNFDIRTFYFKHKMKVIVILSLIIFLIIIFVFFIYLFSQVNILRKEIQIKENLIEQIHYENREKQSKLNDLEEKVKRAEGERAERLSLPKCDDPYVTKLIISAFEKERNRTIKSVGTFKYTNIDLKYPTATSYDENIPRYECKGNIVYDYSYVLDHGNSGYEERNQQGVTYTISKSNGKPVVYYSYSW